MATRRALLTHLAVWLVVGWLVLSLQACIIVEDSPAPGCVQYLGLAPMGGCQGRTVILDLHVTPQPTCLDIEVNNCNGGVLEVYNRCGDPLTLGGVTVQPDDNVSLDISPEDETALVETWGNFAAYTPSVEVRATFTGTLGGKTIAVTFRKTAPLCGETAPPQSDE